MRSRSGILSEILEAAKIEFPLKETRTRAQNLKDNRHFAFLEVVNPVPPPVKVRDVLGGAGL